MCNSLKLKTFRLILNCPIFGGAYSLITSIPDEIFREINPSGLVVIVGDVSAIKRTLEIRDNKAYSLELLEAMQRNELQHAKNISRELDIQLEIAEQTDYSNILSMLNK